MTAESAMDYGTKMDHPMMIQMDWKKTPKNCLGSFHLMAEGLILQGKPLVLEVILDLNALKLPNLSWDLAIAKKRH